MGIVVHEFEVLETETGDVLDRRIDPQVRQRTRISGQLNAGLVEVIAVQMRVATCVNEVTGLQVTGLPRP